MFFVVNYTNFINNMQFCNLFSFSGEHPMKFVGGFIGTAIDARADGSMAVRPAIGWMTFYEDAKIGSEQDIE